MLPASFGADAQRLGVMLDDTALARFAQLGAELIDWNQRLNLTAIDDAPRIATHHFLDSLSVASHIGGARVADVGTGGGFPGLPLAIVQPERSFTLIDSVAKKLRFVDHMVQRLGLGNVTTLHARVEALDGIAPFDCVVTRAFAPLPRLCEWVRPLCTVETRVLAMKGRWPPEAGGRDSDRLPRGWQLDEVLRVEVPGLDAERHILRLRRAPAR